jgi:RHS repeat-associated protein
LVRASLALADLDYQVGNSLLTGQREEAGLGLYDYGARWYDPRLRRFIQPIVPNPRDAQSFDRYAYVNNNPLKYVDPTGHQAVCTMDAQNNTQCNDNAVTGGQTLTIDLADEPQSFNPDGTGFFMTMGGLLVGSLAVPLIAPYVAALLPAAAEGRAATVTAACADGNCTNEVQSVTPSLQKVAATVQSAGNTINWLEGQIRRVEHILAPKHEWGRLTNLTGNLSDDYRAVQPFIQQAVDSGTKSVINQSPVGALVEFNHIINNQQVVVRAVQTAQNAFQITDAWVVK